MRVGIKVGSNLLFNYHAHGAKVSAGLNKALTETGDSVRVVGTAGAAVLRTRATFAELGATPWLARAERVSLDLQGTR
ncbi:MAG: hypothetical protein WAL38_36390 [Solirubrobacteraceae bacterium]